MAAEFRGFTLVELIVVIVLVGVLAATALPRFVNISADARISALNTLKGAITQAANMANMACAVQPPCNIKALGAYAGGVLTDTTIHIGGSPYYLHRG